MKILHTDKDETPAVEMPAEQFINQIQQQKPIDITTGEPVTEQPTPVKKNNKALWGVILLVVVLIIATLIYYFQIKKQRDEYSGN